MREPGEWIHGKYQVQRVLGAGGMGTVYATKRRNESLAAVKVLHRQFAQDKSIRARFLEEGYLANRVGHPAVVSIVEDDIDEEGNFYIVMELLDGVDLSKFVGPPRTLITTAQALNIADQLLSTLIQAHQKGIVHLDIKPANVMLLRDGRLMLLDFGIAKALSGEGFRPDLDDEEEGAGTDRYMSPEQGNGSFDEIDARSDLWSVGALLMALLAEQDQRAVPLWDQSYEDRAWSFSRLGQGVPPHVVQILSLALQPQKANRWVSAAAMKEAVHAAHLDLYGPITRDALAQLVSPKLGESPPEFRSDVTADDESVAGFEPTRRSAPSRPSPVPLSVSSQPVALEQLSEEGNLHSGPAISSRPQSRGLRTWAVGLLLFTLGGVVALAVLKMGSSQEGEASKAGAPIDSASKAPPSSSLIQSDGRKGSVDPAQSEPVHLDNVSTTSTRDTSTRDARAATRDPVDQQVTTPPHPPHLVRSEAKLEKNTLPGTTATLVNQDSDSARVVNGAQHASDPDPSRPPAGTQSSPKNKACGGLDGLFNVEPCD